VYFIEATSAVSVNTSSVGAMGGAYAVSRRRNSSTVVFLSSAAA